ncbi:MAG: family 43 glycosylhydrolase [Bacteroidaceae bacterium]|nr:family 43 glycosylhydrolase [Bacteroidaceae bacterium]
MTICLKKTLLALILLSGRCIAQNPFGNPLVPDMIADASLQQIGDKYYCFATTDGYGRGLDTSGPPVVWTSDNFVDWSFDGIYFPSAEKQKYWAPSKLAEKNGRYYIYPTINAYMYPAVSDTPTGPFRLAKGEDKFELPYTKGATLIDGDDVGGIDAEVFVDDDGSAYMFWGRYHVARLKEDMVTLDSVTVIPTPHREYSEGPVFFKRKGIYYYLYTLDGDENYHYAYMMSRESPLGPWEYPDNNIIAETDSTAGVFGPGHGCVFNPNNTDDYYFVYLEFGRRSTNRQTYVNRMDFNDDGTIKPIQLNLTGVGAIAGKRSEKTLAPLHVSASSVRSPLFIEYMKNPDFKRTEYFYPSFAFDSMNGSRWMPASGEAESWIMADFGKLVNIERSAIYFVRPTSIHNYRFETSLDGVNWKILQSPDNGKIKAPANNLINDCVRFLRVTIINGEPGIWEWKVYEAGGTE